MSKPYQGFTLLAVDDNPDNLFTLRTLLQKHLGVDILEATGGMQALEIAQSNPDIDLIILDIQMPDVDGFETAQMLKARRKTRDIPIIFLTAAFKTEEFQQRGYEIGAVDYLLKPIDDNQLINKVTTYFRLIEKERGLNQILEQQVAERTAELHQANQHLQKIVENMGEALFVLAPEGHILEANPAAQQLLGYSAEELQGMSIGDVFEEEGEDQANAFMGTWLEALIRSGAIKDIEASLVDRRGERVPILFSRTAILNEHGGIDQILCIAKNMRGYRKVETSE